jgi:hypothetical protein
MDRWRRDCGICFDTVCRLNKCSTEYQCSHEDVDYEFSGMPYYRFERDKCKIGDKAHTEILDKRCREVLLLTGRSNHVSASAPASASAPVSNNNNVADNTIVSS